MRRVSDDPPLPPDQVSTPDVVGMVVDRAREVAEAAGVVLAQIDPDGPPVAELTWQRPVTVLSQDPPAGTMVPRWGSVVVTWTGEGTSVREPRRPLPRSIRGAEEGDGREAALEQ
jgi:beta-lactam-binding protein with PASTA domain